MEEIDKIEQEIYENYTNFPSYLEIALNLTHQFRAGLLSMDLLEVKLIELNNDFEDRIKE